jgi:hypothetical protein
MVIPHPTLRLLGKPLQLVSRIEIVANGLRMAQEYPKGISRGSPLLHDLGINLAQTLP